MWRDDADMIFHSSYWPLPETPQLPVLVAYPLRSQGMRALPGHSCPSGSLNTLDPASGRDGLDVKPGRLPGVLLLVPFLCVMTWGGRCAWGSFPGARLKVSVQPTGPLPPRLDNLPRLLPGVVQTNDQSIGEPLPRGAHQPTATLSERSAMSLCRSPTSHPAKSDRGINT